MRLSSDEENVNADLFKKLRCDDSEAIEKVRGGLNLEHR